MNTPVGMAIIKKTKDNKHWQVWGKGNPCTLLVEIQVNTLIMENYMKVPQKFLSLVLVLTSVIPATQEAEIRRIAG
jgi:hypothetical protein